MNELVDNGEGRILALSGGPVVDSTGKRANMWLSLPNRDLLANVVARNDDVGSSFGTFSVSPFSNPTGLSISGETTVGTPQVIVNPSDGTQTLIFNGGGDAIFYSVAENAGGAGRLLRVNNETGGLVPQTNNAQMQTFLNQFVDSDGIPLFGNPALDTGLNADGSLTTGRFASNILAAAGLAGNAVPVPLSVSDAQGNVSIQQFIYYTVPSLDCITRVDYSDVRLPVSDNATFNPVTGENTQTVKSVTGQTSFSVRPGTAPTDLTLATSGAVFFTEANSNRVGRIAPASGALEEITLPLPQDRATRIVTGPAANNHVYFLVPNSDAVYRSDNQGVLTGPFKTSTTGSGLKGIGLGPDNNIWVTEATANKLAMLSTGATPFLTEFVLAVKTSSPTTGATLTRSGTIQGLSPVMTAITSTTGLSVGMNIIGPGVPTGTTILTIDSGTQVTMSQPAPAGPITANYDFAGPAYVQLTDPNSPVFATDSSTPTTCRPSDVKLVENFLVFAPGDGPISQFTDGGVPVVNQPSFPNSLIAPDDVPQSGITQLIATVSDLTAAKPTIEYDKDMFAHQRKTPVAILQDVGGEVLVLEGQDAGQTHLLNSKILRYSNAGARIAEISLDGNGTLGTQPGVDVNPTSMAYDSQNNLWITMGGAFNGNGVIHPGGLRKITFTRGGGNVITAIASQQDFATVANSFPNFIAVGPDGRMWWTERGNTNLGVPSAVGAINLDGTGLTESQFTGVNVDSGPRGIASDGTAFMYFAEQATDKVARVGTGAGGSTAFAFQRFPADGTSATLPPTSMTAGAQPSGIVVGSNGTIYFTESNRNCIGQMTSAG
ncbi:MAG: hypothetical protein FJX76_17425, partial [Armatimonadetes bacterium]|nr:hypothetical protein [Armatimonadota bacterium]